MKITFLEAQVTLSKTFTTQGSNSYPLVKNFTSHSYYIPDNFAGMQQKADYIREHAAKGHCLYKGNLTQELENESRKNKTDNDEMTRSLILDIDGMPYTAKRSKGRLTGDNLIECTEEIIQLLPDAFHNVSYITQASASMGRKPGKANLHIEFFLSNEVKPRVLKEFLISLNLNCLPIRNTLELTASGTGLSYPIDICLADNSRIIYIAPPTFQGVDNPFKNNEDRIQVVEKDNETLDIINVFEKLDSDKIDREIKKVVRQLRKLNGLSPKRTQSQRLNTKNGTHLVVTNPDSINLTFVSDNGQWLQFNRKGGDSRGYYVDKATPNILRNFKGEDNVLLPEADPETYQWIIENHAPDAMKHEVPFAFRDYNTNAYINGFYNPQTKKLTQPLAKTSQTNLKDFYAYHGHVMPETLPQWKLSYTPPGKPGVDEINGTVNSFVLSDLMSDTDKTELNKDTIGEFGAAINDLEGPCPYITKIISHAAGSDAEAVERFVNWLAFIVQERDKTQTAWVFQGVQGTGKGIMYEHILVPLFGESNCSSKTSQNLDDDKNAWIGNKLFIMLDEFSYKNSRHWAKTSEVLKKLISDKKLTVRQMFTDQLETASWVNFILFSNHVDPIRIEDSDRRMNICPRQNTPLNKVIPNINTVVSRFIPEELPYFTKYLQEFQYNERAVHFCWENDAKQVVRETTMTSPEEFCKALHEGDIEFFLPYLDEQAITATELELKRFIDKILKHWVDNIEKTHRVVMTDLCHIYNFINARNGGITSPQKMNKILAHNGIHVKKRRVEGKVARTIEVTWKTRDLAKDKVREAYFPGHGEVVTFPQPDVENK